jgi:hypothetical protein
VAEGRHLLVPKIDAAVVDLEVRDGDEAELIRQLHEGDPAYRCWRRPPEDPARRIAQPWKREPRRC